MPRVRLRRLRRPLRVLVVLTVPASAAKPTPQPLVRAPRRCEPTLPRRIAEASEYRFRPN